MHITPIAVLIFTAATIAPASAQLQTVNPPSQDAPASGFGQPATTGFGTVPQAPVGHRQPTIGSLPPSVRRDEDSTTGARDRAVDPFAGVPNICNGC